MSNARKDWQADEIQELRGKVDELADRIVASDMVIEALEGEVGRLREVATVIRPAVEDFRHYLTFPKNLRTVTLILSAIDKALASTPAKETP